MILIPDLKLETRKLKFGAWNLKPGTRAHRTRNPKLEIRNPTKQMPRPISIFISAGEASGDLHGAGLARALLSRAPEARISCLGGSHLQQAGARLLVNNRDIAVVGVAEIARHVKSIVQAWRTLSHHLAAERPALAVFIDFPDFNLMLARKARRLGCKIFYYISPQLWAWRSGRVRTLRRLVDRMAVILPFETEFYARHGMKVEYVGHPLLDSLTPEPSRETACRLYRPEDASLVVGLLPGSRSGEIRALLPTLLRAAEIIQAAVPTVSFILPAASTISEGFLEQQVRAMASIPVRVIAGDTRSVISACDLILTASGTVTLEAAIIGTPMVIFYRVSKLSEPIGRLLIKARFAGLPNLIAGRAVAPELIQNDFQPQRLADTALDLLRHPQHLDDQRRELAAVRRQLGEPGVADRVARLALELVAA
jgi:lipid-A-disaccharide synthase